MIGLAADGPGDSDRHLMTLFGLALGRRGKLYLELGVRDGATTLPLLMAAYTVGAQLVSVDKRLTSFVPPAYLAESWRFTHMDALVYLKTCPLETCFDLVLIDDDHTNSHVMVELSYLDRHVSPRSLILIHDTMYGQSPCYHSDPLARGTWAEGGPYGALVSYCDPDIWEWATVPYGHGLTLLRKKYSTAYFSVEDDDAKGR